MPSSDLKLLGGQSSRYRPPTQPMSTFDSFCPCLLRLLGPFP